MTTEEEAPPSVAASPTSAVPDSDSLIPESERSIPQLLPQPPPPPPAKVRVVVANDVVKKGEVRKDNNKGDLLSSSRRICCFPSKLRWAAFRHSLVGFQTSSKSFRKHARSSHKLRFDQTGFNSHDLFWSEEEECPKNEDSEKKVQEIITPATLKTDLDFEGFPECKTTKESGTVCSVKNCDGFKTEGFQEVQVSCHRKHTMLTVHTPDHKGFLGIPKISGLSGDNGVKQVDRLGARLSHMISKSNYTEVRHSQVGNSNGKEESCAEPHSGWQAPPVTFSPSFKLPKMKRVGSPIRSAPMPPPSPISPLESWLLARSIPTLKKPSRKPLGSFIPIKPPVPPGKKPSASESCKDLPRCGVLPPSCSLKDQLQHRQSISHTVQAV